MATATISARVSANFAKTAKERKCSVSQLADQCLDETQKLRIIEQEISLSRLDKMERDIQNIIHSNNGLEEKIDTLSILLTDLFRKLGE